MFDDISKWSGDDLSYVYSVNLKLDEFNKLMSGLRNWKWGEY